MPVTVVTYVFTISHSNIKKVPAAHTVQVVALGEEAKVPAEHTRH